jgi:hypothetical protein
VSRVAIAFPPHTIQSLYDSALEVAALDGGLSASFANWLGEAVSPLTGTFCGTRNGRGIGRKSNDQDGSSCDNGWKAYPSDTNEPSKNLAWTLGSSALFRPLCRNHWASRTVSIKFRMIERSQIFHKNRVKILKQWSHFFWHIVVVTSKPIIQVMLLLWVKSGVRNSGWVQPIHPHLRLCCEIPDLPRRFSFSSL